MSWPYGWTIGPSWVSDVVPGEVTTSEHLIAGFSKVDMAGVKLGGKPGG